MPRSSMRSGTTSHRNTARLSTAQEDLGHEWNHVTRGGRVVNAKIPSAPTVPQTKPQGEGCIPHLWRRRGSLRIPHLLLQVRSFLRMISDLAQGRSLSVLATLTHQLVANFGFFLTGSYRPSAVLKHVIFLIAHYGCTAKEDLQAKLCG